MTATIEKLAASGIQLLPAFAIANHWVFERDGFVCLVERTADGGFGRIGAPGKLTEAGFAALVWRGRQAYFVAKGFEQPAQPDDVDGLRRFDLDLRAALQT